MLLSTIAISTIAIPTVLVVVLGVILYFILKNPATTLATTNINIPGSLTASALNISGASKIESLEIGSIGSTTFTEVRGIVMVNAEIAGAGGFATTVAANFTGNVVFSSIPNVICSLQLQAGANYWDQCSVAVSSTSTSQVVFGLRNNNPNNNTSGVVNINYIAWV